MEKYLRTFHLPFSPEIHSDDKKADEIILKNFENKNIIITEKLDGGNCCIKPGIGVFARTHSLPTDCETFNYIKNIHYFSKLHLLNKDYHYFGENLFAIHSIEYTNLKDYFYLFKIFDTKRKIWLSYEDVIKEAKRCNYNVVPLIYKGKMLSLKNLKIFLDDEIKKESFLGGNREGFVVSLEEEFIEKNEFFTNTVKYVRKGHVQSDEFWKVNWKQQKLNI